MGLKPRLPTPEGLNFIAAAACSRLVIGCINNPEGVELHQGSIGITPNKKEPIPGLFYISMTVP